MCADMGNLLVCVNLSLVDNEPVLGSLVAMFLAEDSVSFHVIFKLAEQNIKPPLPPPPPLPPQASNRRHHPCSDLRAKIKEN